MTALHVRVRVAEEQYALPVDEVLEVAEVTEIAAVPGAAEGVVGVVNLRGNVLPVLNLAAVLGLSGAATPERIVVVERDGRTAGLAVDAVAGVEQLPEPSEEVESPHLIGATLADGELVGVVNVGSILSGLDEAASR